jgi:hypothetical protein
MQKDKEPGLEKTNAFTGLMPISLILMKYATQRAI